MKMRNKGKVHPSPSSSSSSQHQQTSPSPLSVLSLLPAAIITLISILSLEDREALAYMLTRTLNSNNTLIKNKKSHNTHKPPVFDCDCFDCYRCYWSRWDTSSHRDIIHQAIEAFEEREDGAAFVGSGSHHKNHQKRNKKREKAAPTPTKVSPATALPEVSPEKEISSEVGFPRGEDSAVVGKSDDVEPETAAVRRSAAVCGGGGHKGLARKVLPDVMGLLNSRLWSLWGPNA